MSCVKTNTRGKETPVSPRRSSAGFTLMELLVVVAIIGVLVAIVVPVFSGQYERARRTVDIANARSIQTQLAIMIGSGEVDVSTAADAKHDDKGLYILVVKPGSTPPQGYGKSSSNVYIRADEGVTVKGHKSTSWTDPKVAELLMDEVKGCFGSNGMRVHSGGFDSKFNGIAGWDWYLVEYFYKPSDHSVGTRIYSGKGGTSSGINPKYNPNTTAIEQMRGLSWDKNTMSYK